MKFLSLYLSLSLSLSSALPLLLTGCGSSTAPDAAHEAQAAPKPAAPVENAYAAANANADFHPLGGGEVTTASGLMYTVLKSGPAGGQRPGPTDAVTVDYRGTLTSGSVFDSSIDRGEPATFHVNQVIAGWTEALQLMKPGDKWMLYIPSRLAYGSEAVGTKIPPNSDLIFQVEVLKVGS